MENFTVWQSWIGKVRDRLKSCLELFCVTKHCYTGNKDCAGKKLKPPISAKLYTVTPLKAGNAK